MTRPDIEYAEDGYTRLKHREGGNMLAYHVEQMLFTIEKQKAADGTVIDPNHIGTSIAADELLREGLRETPARVAKAWLDDWARGYTVDVAGLLKTFEDGADGVDEMIVVKNIPLYSHCEHHLAAIFGTATVAYIPSGRIVGLSKINRVVDAFARRLQVQERLTRQIADAINEHLKPVGVGVQVRARHLCMESRGVCQQGHHTITNALIGAIKDDPKARAEFLAACNGAHP